MKKLKKRKNNDKRKSGKKVERREVKTLCEVEEDPGEAVKRRKKGLHEFLFCFFWMRMDDCEKEFLFD